MSGEAGEGFALEEPEAAFCGMELSLEEHPLGDIDREEHRPLDRRLGYHRRFGVLGDGPEQRELGDLLVHADDLRSGVYETRFGERLSEAHERLAAFLQESGSLRGFGDLGDGEHSRLDGRPFARGELFGDGDDARRKRHEPFRRLGGVLVGGPEDQAASEEPIAYLVLGERVQELLGDARSEKAEVRIHYRPDGTFLVGLAAKDVFGRAGGEEAADALAHGLRGLVRAAHGAEEGRDLVGLEQQAGALEELVLDRLAGGEGLGDGLAEVDALGEAGVGLAGVVLADAGVAEHHDVEVGARAVRVGVAAAREVREHGERTGEREDAVGAVAGREREVGQFADEARHTGQLFRQRTRVGEGRAL